MDLQLLCGALTAAVPTRLPAQVDAARASASAMPLSLLMRSDDGGMSHRDHRQTSSDEQQSAGRARRVDVDAIRESVVPAPSG